MSQRSCCRRASCCLSVLLAGSRWPGHEARAMAIKSRSRTGNAELKRTQTCQPAALSMRSSYNLPCYYSAAVVCHAWVSHDAAPPGCCWAVSYRQVDIGGL